MCIRPAALQPKYPSLFPMATRYKPLPAIAIKSLETSAIFEDVLRLSESQLNADSEDNPRFVCLNPFAETSSSAFSDWHAGLAKNVVPESRIEVQECDATSHRYNRLDR